MMALDALGGELQRVDHLPVGRGKCGADLGLGHLYSDLGEVDTVETGGIIDQRLIAASAHIVDDGAHHRIHVFRDLPLGRQKCRKPCLKIRRRLIQPNCQADIPSSSKNDVIPVGLFGQTGPDQG
jgi:hypothetical protein